ncbi:MAG: ATP-binding cassette domain-containing protein, partial [Oscillatoriales cyanobacterium RM1_1_9]|nr:ATP-binding cassette domain-containing protein [Oscillatoriales cyanobacterium RM1_1_9]
MKIVLENVHKSYGKRAIVSRVNLSVAQGEIVGLLGPNGAGKTTTFYLVTGLEKPNQGNIYLDEQNITGLPIHKRAQFGIGYLPQEPSIFRHLSVRDNLLLVLEQTHVPRQFWRRRVETLLEEFRLDKIAHNLGNQVSGGERRRTEMARALAAGIDSPQFYC